MMVPIFSARVDELALVLAALTREVFEVEDIGGDQPFADVGATSLHAALLASRILEETGVRLTLAEVGSTATIMSLVDRLHPTHEAIPSMTAAVASSGGLGHRPGLNGSLEDVLRLESPAPAPSLAVLTDLYRRWCRSMSFDNATRVLQLREGHEHLSGRPVDEYVRNVVAYGTGGMCVPSALALCELLRRRGFEALVWVGTIEAGPQPDHLSVLTEVDDETYVVDTVNLTDFPVVLNTSSQWLGPAVHEPQVAQVNGVWNISYRTAADRARQTLVLHAPLVDNRDALDLYRRTQQSQLFRRFNSSLYARVNVADGIVTVIGDHVIRTDQAGATSQVVESVAVCLTREFGMSPAFVDRLSAAGVVRG